MTHQTKNFFTYSCTSNIRPAKLANSLVHSIGFRISRKRRVSFFPFDSLFRVEAPSTCTTSHGTFCKRCKMEEEYVVDGAHNVFLQFGVKRSIKDATKLAERPNTITFCPKTSCTRAMHGRWTRKATFVRSAIMEPLWHLNKETSTTLVAKLEFPSIGHGTIPREPTRKSILSAGVGTLSAVRSPFLFGDPVIGHLTFREHSERKVESTLRRISPLEWQLTC